MIYGYARKTVNEFGLKEMEEISITASPAVLRELASHLQAAAKELENEDVSQYWHLHAPNELAKQLGCDFIICTQEST